MPRAVTALAQLLKKEVCACATALLSTAHNFQRTTKAPSLLSVGDFSELLRLRLWVWRLPSTLASTDRTEYGQHRPALPPQPWTSPLYKRRSKATLPIICKQIRRKLIQTSIYSYKQFCLTAATERECWSTGCGGIWVSRLRPEPLWHQPGAEASVSAPFPHLSWKYKIYLNNTREITESANRRSFKTF